MNKLRLASAWLLALPLIVFGGNAFAQLFEMPESEPSPGVDLLQAMHDGGLMTAIAASHVLIGLMLLLPRSRFAAGLLQLPLSIGMVAFHATMLPEGLAMAGVLLALNLLVIADGARLRSLFAAPAGKATQ